MNPPIWKSENAAGCSVSHSASVAAIFIGWASVTATPNSAPQPQLDDRDGQDDDDRELRRAAEHLDVSTPPQVPAGHAEDEEAAGHQSGEDGMPPGEEHEALEEDLEDVRGLRPAGLGVDFVADRVLHPRVGREDEVGREPRAGPDEVDGREVHLRGEPVPAEEPQADEGRLEHERAETLDRQRRAEDVADVGRESRPVHPELELHHQAGGDPDREVDQEERPEEARQAEPLLVAGPVPERLHHRQKRCQPERQRDEDEMEERRQRELPARQLDNRVGERSQAKLLSVIVSLQSPLDRPEGP